MINCIITGVGGQGTLLASKLIAQAAMNKGMNVRTSETIGMAQRGGCVVSHVRLGDEIHSPMIPLHSADIIIGFEPAEAVRCLSYLKEGGTVIVSKNAIKPVTDTLAKTNYDENEMVKYLSSQVQNLIVIDGRAITEQSGSSKVLNTVLLGAAAAAGVLGVTVEELKQTICEKLPAKFVDINLQALLNGEKAV